jgi:hypothetical protein
MKYLLPAFLLVGLTASAPAQDKENPFKKAKVGDWAEYKVVAKFAGMDLDGKMKVTVTDKNDKVATLKTTSVIKGMEQPPQEGTVDLTKPYDPLTSFTPKDAELKVEKVADGKEKIKVGGKEYDCTWMKVKFKGKAGGQVLEGDAKVWTSDSVPLGGTVKMEMTQKVMGLEIAMMIELLETGGK